MPKYTQEIKDKAVELAKKGIALKTIQTELGPNPKATQRYLKAIGIDYAALRKKLKEKGELKSATKKQEEKKESKTPVQKQSQSEVKKQTSIPKVTKKVE